MRHSGLVSQLTTILLVEELGLPLSLISFYVMPASSAAYYMMQLSFTPPPPPPPLYPEKLQSGAANNGTYTLYTMTLLPTGLRQRDSWEGLGG